MKEGEKERKEKERERKGERWDVFFYFKVESLRSLKESHDRFVKSGLYKSKPMCLFRPEVYRTAENFILVSTNGERAVAGKQLIPAQKTSLQRTEPQGFPPFWE